MTNCLQLDLYSPTVQISQPSNFTSTWIENWNFLIPIKIFVKVIVGKFTFSQIQLQLIPCFIHARWKKFWHYLKLVYRVRPSICNSAPVLVDDRNWRQFEIARFGSIQTQIVASRSIASLLRHFFDLSDHMGGKEGRPRATPPKGTGKAPGKPKGSSSMPPPAVSAAPHLKGKIKGNAPRKGKGKAVSDPPSLAAASRKAPPVPKHAPVAPRATVAAKPPPVPKQHVRVAPAAKPPATRPASPKRGNVKGKGGVIKGHLKGKGSGNAKANATKGKGEAADTNTTASGTQMARWAGGHTNTKN